MQQDLSQSASKSLTQEFDELAQGSMSFTAQQDRTIEVNLYPEVKKGRFGNLNVRKLKPSIKGIYNGAIKLIKGTKKFTSSEMQTAGKHTVRYFSFQQGEIVLCKLLRERTSGNRVTQLITFPAIPDATGQIVKKPPIKANARVVRIYGVEQLRYVHWLNFEKNQLTFMHKLSKGATDKAIPFENLVNRLSDFHLMADKVPYLKARISFVWHHDNANKLTKQHIKAKPFLEET